MAAGAAVVVIAVAAGGLWLGGFRPWTGAAAAGTPTTAPTLPVIPDTHPARDRRSRHVRFPSVALDASSSAVLRLQQLLAEAGYLPVAFHESPYHRQALATQAPSPLDPLQGRFSWRWRDTPKALRALWSPGTATVMTQGAVMTFEEVNGMTTDGIAGPAVWKALERTVRVGKRDPYPYSWAYVSQAIPESLRLWQNGRIVLTTAANTGIPQAPTQPGTWPVYLRFTSTTMSGTNPDGSHYSDPGVPWVSYFHGGDAVHGFLRASYGSPQSLGCVELPYADAKVAFDHMTYGTLVTVAP